MVYNSYFQFMQQNGMSKIKKHKTSKTIFSIHAET